MGKEVDTPPVPDYGSLARQQAALNQQAALQNTYTNRPNQINPYGSLTWTNNPTMTRQLDADAYAQALDQYSKAERDYNNPTINPAYMSSGGADSGAQMYALPDQSSTPAPVAPNKDDFYREMPMDNWTQTQTLSPQYQQILDQKAQIQQALLSALLARYTGGGGQQSNNASALNSLLSVGTGSSPNAIPMPKVGG